MEEKKDNERFSDEDLMILSMENGQELECVVLAIYDVDNKQYIALIPSDKYDDEDADIYLYGYSEDADGNPQLTDIEDDDEFEAACDRFDELMDEEDFEELPDEEK